ncbi:MAG: hypothetical protein E6I38_03495 [Chloroflexi bacterium]|nr:MAG: hypothetical protein E6I38_03495 [Chloroflexota bacterium]
MGRFLIAGLAVLILGAIAVVGFTANSQAQTVTPTDTPAGSPTDTPAPTASATTAGSATPTSSVAATTAGTATATPRVQPAAVPVTGGNPSDGSANLILILAIALGAVAGTAGVLAASYGLTRRS